MTDNTLRDQKLQTLRDGSPAPLAPATGAGETVLTREAPDDVALDEPVGDVTTVSGEPLPTDPTSWNRAYLVKTGEPCPECYTPANLCVAPADTLTDWSRELADQYGRPATVADWTERFETPVYLFCSNAECDWHRGNDWSEVQQLIKHWSRDDIPDHVAERGGGGTA